MKWLMKIVVVLILAVIPTFIVYGATYSWGAVIILWVTIGSMVSGFALFRGSALLLRKALMFLGMKPETLDRQYGNYYGPWWRS